MRSTSAALNEIGEEIFGSGLQNRLQVLVDVSIVGDAG